MPKRQLTLDDQTRVEKRKLLDRLGRLLALRKERFRVGSASNTISPIDLYRVLDALYGWTVSTGQTDVTACRLKPGISEAVARRGFGVLASVEACSCVMETETRISGSPRKLRSICWPNLLDWVTSLEAAAAVLEQGPRAQAEPVTGSAGARHGLRLIGSRAQADPVHLYGTTPKDTHSHCGASGDGSRETGASGAGEWVGFEEFIEEVRGPRAEGLGPEPEGECACGRDDESLAGASGNLFRADQAPGVQRRDGVWARASGSGVRSMPHGAVPVVPASVPPCLRGESSGTSTLNPQPSTAPMNTRSVSPLETDADLLWVLEVYQLDNPRGTIRAAIEAGHTEQTLRARIGYLRSQLVQVPFTERGACTVQDAPSWKFPFYAGKVRACLVNPDKVQGDPALGWGSVDAVWASYDKEASQLAFPAEGASSPKQWVPEDAYRGKPQYAPMGGSHDEKPKTKRFTTEARRHGENKATGESPATSGGRVSEPVGSGPTPVESGSPKAIDSVPPCLRGESAPDRLEELLATKEGRAELWQLVAKHCMGAARLKPQFDSGNLLNSGLMAARTALKMEGER